LQEGRLVLVSPFHPEAAFNAGNAMGRNRYIYSLADQALVIDSAVRTGGTWAGAVENLQHGWVPLYVRSPGEGAGNAALIAQGGMPFTADDARCDSLSDFFASRASSLVADAPAAQASLPLVSESETDFAVSSNSSPAASALAEQASVEEPAVIAPHSGPISSNAPLLNDGLEASLDMFTDFASKLRAVFASGPLTDEDVATLLCIEKGQAKAWLKRACETGAVEKLKKPVRYTLGRQGTLC